MRYFDSAYIAKCYLPEADHAIVSAFAAKAERIASVAIARLEVAAVFHRKLREQTITTAIHRELHRQFDDDLASGIWRFLPVSEPLLLKTHAAYKTLGPSVFVRSADCLHLVAAREAGFAEIYSNDRHLLAAAAHFGLKGIDLTATA